MVNRVFLKVLLVFGKKWRKLEDKEDKGENLMYIFR